MLRTKLMALGVAMLALCGLRSNAQIVVPPALTTPIAGIINPTCVTGTGSIIVVKPISPTFVYSVDGGAYQKSTTFGGLEGGSIHSITVKNSQGQTASGTGYYIFEAPDPAAATIVVGGAGTYCSGATATLKATASPLYAYNYQWYNGGTAISGATASTYSFATSGSGTANYTVSTNNSCGTTTSGNYPVVVNAAPAITSQPVSTATCTGTATAFSVTATGTPTSYQWYYNGGPIGADHSDVNGTYTGSTTATLNITPTGTFFNGAQFSCRVANSCGTTTSTVATLTLNAAATSVALTGTSPYCSGSTATLTATASPAGAYTYQWYSNGSAISGATNSVYSFATNGSGTTNYTVKASNTCGSQTSGTYALVVNAAASGVALTGTSPYCSGSTATLTAAASPAGAYTYQWYSNGTAISGATASTYSFTTGGSGTTNYTVSASNTCGSQTSGNYALVVNPATAITSQPAATSACVGGSTSFSVAANAATSYQWYMNGVATGTGDAYNTFSGSNTATLTVKPTSTLSNGGRYTVTVTSGCGSATSSAAILTVNATTAITAQPQSATITSGQTKAFSVTATGTSLSYQWKLNGNNISGATSATYTTGTAGTYSVAVTGSCSSVTSSGAVLTVTPACTVGYVLNDDFSYGATNGWSLGGCSQFGYPDAGDKPGNSYMVLDGNDFCSGGIAYKTFATIIGVSYKVAIGSRGAGVSTSTIITSINNGVITTYAAVWADYSFTFKATSSSTTLKFQAGGSTFQSAAMIRYVQVSTSCN